MDLSVQKMQPPAALSGKSAAKKANQGDSDDAVENVDRDKEVRFAHGNTAYEETDPDEQREDEASQHKRKGRRKNRQLLSQDDLSQLTTTLAEQQPVTRTADGLMNMRAYQAPSKPDEDEKAPHFEVNI